MALGECNQKAIAEYCEIEPATVGSILTRMERDGLVRRSQREGNRRSLYVALTPRGERMGEVMEDVFRRADTLACAQLTPGQQEQLRTLLEAVSASIMWKKKEEET